MDRRAGLLAVLFTVGCASVVVPGDRDAGGVGDVGLMDTPQDVPADVVRDAGSAPVDAADVPTDAVRLDALDATDPRCAAVAAGVYPLGICATASLICPSVYSGTPCTCQYSCNSPCVPRTCAQVGANCGPIPDGCGALLDCGACSTPDACGAGGVPNVCGSPTDAPCVPLRCDQVSQRCGVIGDGCGNVLDCGRCVWACPLEPPRPSGCPADEPAAGTSCTLEGTACIYAGACCVRSSQCTNGQWGLPAVDCPP